MHVRMTRVRASPQRLELAFRYFADRWVPEAKKTEGYAGPDAHPGTGVGLLQKMAFEFVS